ncbi:nucleotidyltransferase family protein, partial [bacterium]
MITKAILLAAGRGTRLGAITATYPKALLEVGDRPIIVRIIEGLAHAGIEEIAIVTGHQAALLEAEVGTGAHAGLGIIYFRQEKLSGTAHALALARDFAGEGQFLFGWGDIVVDPTNYRRVLKAARSADAVIAGQTDATPPTVFVPQREPYNPGGMEWGTQPQPSDFTVWTFAYDVSGLNAVTLNWRVDGDGENPIASIQNETYAGGSEVGPWNSEIMTIAPMP